ncbi:unnamed protein product [Allacma fusca]|uniref:Uncharacterized protein n=1 Tax=Allacma fusca TaxID=39272 RepID=A0A8J2LHJ6_9HEXA|nr:unnamed protein product [Allacma fusca]
MDSQDTSGHLVLQAEFCLCNNKQHYFLSDPVIIFDCCCPEIVPSGSFSMKIPTKPPILHFKCPLSYEEIASTFQSDPSLKYFQNPENFVLDYESLNEPDEQPNVDISGAKYTFEGKECIEECINYHNMGYYPSDQNNGMDHFESTIDLELLEQITFEPETPPDFIHSLEMPESGPGNDEENVMKIMDFVFRDMDSNQLDHILKDLSLNEMTDL